MYNSMTTSFELEELEMIRTSLQVYEQQIKASQVPYPQGYWYTSGKTHDRILEHVAEFRVKVEVAIQSERDRQAELKAKREAASANS